jgi:hypothetical protein
VSKILRQGDVGASRRVPAHHRIAPPLLVTMCLDGANRGVWSVETIAWAGDIEEAVDLVA